MSTSEESCKAELVEIGRSSRKSMLKGQTPVSYLAKLVQRTEKAAKEAREFNQTLQPDHQEQFYLAGMNAIAEKFWTLARNKHSDPQEIRTYADLLHDHFEQKIKVQKNSIALRHLTLLEAKSKALQELAKDTSLTGAQYVEKIRSIFGYEKHGNGHENGQHQRLLQDGLAS